MRKERRDIPRRFKVLNVIIIVLVVLMAVFWIYTSNYYHADKNSARSSSADVSVMETDDGYYIDGPGRDKVMIFYPGGKVEESAYIPLMVKFAEDGIDSYIVRMPYRLAVFKQDAAADVMSEYKTSSPSGDVYSSWYIGGHSLGGAMAANYAASHPGMFDGVILMAAYPTKKLSDRTIVFYGTKDKVLNLDKLLDAKKNMPDDYREVVIHGGNHAQYGNYGSQKGDGTAKISRSRQQEIVADTAAAWTEEK